MKRHRGFSGRPQQPAGQPSTLQVGTDQAGGPIEVFENPLGGEVAAADRALHRRWPAGIGPVTRHEEAVNRCPLRGPQPVHARSDGEGRPVLGHDPPPQQAGLSCHWPDLGQVGEDGVADRQLVEQKQVVEALITT